MGARSGDGNYRGGPAGPRPKKRPLVFLCQAMNDAILEMCVENKGRPLAKSMTDFVEFSMEGLASGEQEDANRNEYLIAVMASKAAQMMSADRSPSDVCTIMAGAGEDGNAVLQRHTYIRLETLVEVIVRQARDGAQHVSFVRCRKHGYALVPLPIAPPLVNVQPRLKVSCLFAHVVGAFLPSAGYSKEQLLLELQLLDSTTRVPGQTLTGVEKRYRTQWISALDFVMQNVSDFHAPTQRLKALVVSPNGYSFIVRIESKPSC